MSNKVFIAIIAMLLVGTFGFTALKKKNEPVVERPGTEQANNGQAHVADGSKEYGEAEPPTSGDHSTPVPWQVYDQEVPDINSIHNLEHGGIYVSYRPDLPPEQISKIKALFGQPFAREGFSPNKALVAPRAANDAPIILSSWTRNLKLEAYDEEKMVEYYLRNIGKSPEAAAS